MALVSVRLAAYTPAGPKLVAAAARVSASKKSLSEAMEMEEGEVDAWLLELVKRGHGSPLEHSSYTFEVVCSRVCSHQLVRHRIASYTQQSMRYTEGFLRSMALKASEALSRRGIASPAPPRPRGARDYEAYAEVLLAAAKALEEGVGGRELASELVGAAFEAFVAPPSVRGEALVELVASYYRAASTYYRLVARGVSMEDARFVIPSAVKTRVVVTMNARELLESFLALRMCSRAQWEIRMVAWLLWRELVKVHPQIFRWAGPRCVLVENRCRREPCSLEGFLEGRCSFTVERCPELVPRDSIPQCLRAAASVLDLESPRL